MKSKRIVYFDENTEDKTHVRRESTSKKNLSISKSLRQSSANKHHKAPSGRISGIEKGNGSQKIRILVTKEGFIFEKKYMIYDIQCTLVKQEKLEPLPERMRQKISEPPQQEESPILDQDCLFLNLQANSFGVTKGLVRHNFNIQKDSSTYIEVRAVGYSVDSIVIANKRIQYVNINDIEAIDEHDMAIIEPIKMIEDSQLIREDKIKQYFQRSMAAKHQGRRLSKSLKICWSNQAAIQNVEYATKINVKKIENEPSSTLNSFSINNFFQAGKETTQRQTSKTKKINYTPMVSQGNKTNRESVQKANLNDLIKNTKEKEVMGMKHKAGSRKFLNDSGLNYGALGKLQGKQNGKKEDAYGLEELSKRSRNKTTQNEDVKKIVEFLDSEPKGDLQPNRYGKNT